MTKKTETKNKPKKVKDKSASATKAAMTPPPMRASGQEATIIPLNAGGPALAAQAAPVAATLVEVSRQWADAKRMEAQGKREADSKRKEMIDKHFEGKPELAIGFKNDFVDIKPDTEIDWTDPALHTWLKEKGWFEALCKPLVLDPELVRSKALTEPELEVRLAALETKKPKFFQVKDAPEDKKF